MKIKWTKPAVDDLESIKEFISRDSEIFANQFVERIFDSVEKLIDFPKIGRMVPEYQEQKVREIIFQNYRVIYFLSSDLIYVLNIIHGARDIKTFGQNEWEII